MYKRKGLNIFANKKEDMRPRKPEHLRYTESMHVRLRRDQAEAIKILSEELNQSVAQTIRDLITISLMITESAERITLRDLLYSVSNRFAETPYGFYWRLEMGQKRKNIEGRNGRKEKTQGKCR
ncbi:hypothetical protein DRJ16_02675 [Candidatus Woesearchaeota archaeon]|nr:MAG: hypothetical protein DRJ16_02675 [Candidatus Woesearchaeota archaeon]